MAFVNEAIVREREYFNLSSLFLYDSVSFYSYRGHRKFENVT